MARGSGFERPPAWAVAALAVAALAFFVLVPIASKVEEPPSFTPPASADDPEPRPPLMLVMGDSFAEGTGADSPPDVLEMRDRLQAEAQKRDLPFIDPLAEEWVTEDNEARVTGLDGTHPTQVGHQLIADHLAQSLQVLGAQPYAGA